MMSFLKTLKLPIPAAELMGESSLPLLADACIPSAPYDSDLCESDGLFLNYGTLSSAFPYRAQDCYSRALTRQGLDAVVLENEHLRASFVPELGGKLWSLYDKDEEKELLFANHVFRPAYLALRNAWASGGVEWNCGAYPGHNPHTCSQMFTAVIDAADSGLGCPVLRLYHFERIRAVTQQMDFYLPDGARYLHCRMRVVNDEDSVTPMYWWSNIAVPSDENSRCIVPADAAFYFENGRVSSLPVPQYGAMDVSYPAQTKIAFDYFFRTYENHRHYTSLFNRDGYGLVQTSTARLKGRKLFVWGRGQGGAKWQEFLSGDDGHGRFCDGQYCEIQCGLANTQYECLPMPPRTAWEWLEYYGPMHADPAKIHGLWRAAQAEAELHFDASAPLDQMEMELSETHTMAVSPASRMLAFGDGWAALENLRRAANGRKPLSPHLDFGAVSCEQEMWKALLETGSLRCGNNGDPSQPPVSYQRREEWLCMLRNAVQGPDRFFWLSHYMLGCAALAEGHPKEAEPLLVRSCELNENAWNLYALAELYRMNGELRRSAETMLCAQRLAPDDDSLCKRTAFALHRAELWQQLAAFTDSVSDAQKKIPRIRLYRSFAAQKLGDPELALSILEADGGLEVPDMREGELSITELWYSIAADLARRDGLPFDRDTVKPPKMFDFRMLSET